MATATTKQQTASTLDHLQHAAQDLDKARARASSDVREGIDAALGKIREAAEGVRGRAHDQTGEWQDALEHANDEMRVELGRRGVRAQSSGDALDALSGEITKRRAVLAA